MRPIIIKIWQAGTFGGVDSLDTNEPGSNDLITLKSCDFEKKLFSSFQQGL